MNKKNTRAIGNLFQNWVEKWIIKTYPGAVVHNQKTASTLVKVRDYKTGELKDIWISKRNDILGCIDLLVIMPDKLPLFIQASVHQGVAKRIKELEQVPWNFPHCHVQLWLKRKPGLVQIKEFNMFDSSYGLKDVAKIIRGKLHLLAKEE